MLYNNSFNINFNRLAELLLPTFLRKATILAFLQSAYSQLAFICNTGLKPYREQTNYRLMHNGQVCYLRKVLNDYFDSEQRRIIIGEAEPKKSAIVYWRELNRLVGAPPRGTTALIVSGRGYSGASGFDFTIQVPAEIYNDARMVKQLKALTTEYKLASKQFDIVPL
jgi:hypothetical protein